MDVITFDAQITQDRRLTGYQIPENAPVGRVTLVIQPAHNQSGDHVHLTRDTARARLLATGRLSTVHHATNSATRLSDAESQRLAQLFADESYSVLDLVNEDRGLRE